MNVWFQVQLPPHMYWWNNAIFWRNALVDRARKVDSRAFTGPNKLRAFPFRHTVTGIVPDLVMVLFDTPKNTATMVLFPSTLGLTVGNVSRSLGEADTPEEVAQRQVAAAAEEGAAKLSGIAIDALPGQDGSSWRVFSKCVDMSRNDWLQADGNTLTTYGNQQVEDFVRGVVIAVGEWFVRSDENRSELSRAIVEVTPLSEIKSGGSPTTGDEDKSTTVTGYTSMSVSSPKSSGGCYVATAVYGSYDCPEVWVLRRWRDTFLAASRPGKILIRVYYAASPHLVRVVGQTAWFRLVARHTLDALVIALLGRGYSSARYSDSVH